MFLPFINAAPSDYDTIYTSLLQSVKQTEKSGMLTCFVTFDQPLYIKARDIIACTPLSDKSFIVPRLGGFHTLDVSDTLWEVVA